MKFFFQYIAVFAVYVPVGAVLIYIIDRGFPKDLRVNLIFLHAVLAVLSQLAMILMGLAAIENIIVMKCYLSLEMFLVLLFYLLFIPGFSKSVKIICSVLLAVITFAVNFLHSTSVFPYYSIFLNGIILFLFGIIVLGRINRKNSYEKGFLYFTVAIIIYSLIYTTTYFYINTLPALAVRIQAVVNIIKYILITIGFYQFYKHFDDEITSAE